MPQGFNVHRPPAFKGKTQADQQRGTAAQRGYDNTWRKARLAFLRRHPLCEICQEHGMVTPAKHVHHRDKVKHRPDLRLNSRNFMALCASCHGRLHMLERTSTA